MSNKENKKIYMDYAAATPVDAEVLDVMRPFFDIDYMNPSGLTLDAVCVSDQIEVARKQCADFFGVQPRNIIFTHGGTASCNIAIQGVVMHYRKQNPDILPHVIISSIEHSAVRNTVISLAERGLVEYSEIPVDQEGVVDMVEFKKLLRPTTILVSVMYANNEIGTIQPIREITKTVRHFRKHITRSAYPLVHTDAIQAVQYLDVHIPRLGADLLTASGAKIYGPKGAGLLCATNKDCLAPILHGGGQESGLCPGTPNVPYIVGLGKVIELVAERKEKETKRIINLRDMAISLIQEKIPEAVINGSLTDRLPNNIHMSFQGILGEQIIIEMDARGISLATGSSCQSTDDGVSHVMTALQGDDAVDQGHVRCTLGRHTTEQDVRIFVDNLAAVMQGIRNTQERFS